MNFSELKRHAYLGKFGVLPWIHQIYSMFPALNFCLPLSIYHQKLHLGVFNQPVRCISGIFECFSYVASNVHRPALKSDAQIAQFNSYVVCKFSKPNFNFEGLNSALATINCNIILTALTCDQALYSFSISV